MKYIQDYAERLLATGPHVFVAQFSSPVLLGLGLVGSVGEPAMGTKRRTLRAVKNGGDIASTAVIGRVWRVRKDQISHGAAQVYLGQSATSDITVAEYSLSERHASFSFDAAGRISIVDHDSLNGTLVNGSVLPPDSAQILQNEDRLAFGRLRFQFLTAQGFFESVYRIAYGCAPSKQTGILARSSASSC